MEHYSAMKRDCHFQQHMDLEYIMLSEICQRKTNSACYPLHVQSKFQK